MIGSAVAGAPTVAVLIVPSFGLLKRRVFDKAQAQHIEDGKRTPLPVELPAVGRDYVAADAMTIALPSPSY